MCQQLCFVLILMTEQYVRSGHRARGDPFPLRSVSLMLIELCRGAVEVIQVSQCVAMDSLLHRHPDKACRPH